MPPLWDQTGVPGFVAFTHFHSSTISGSASLMIPRTLLSVWPRQSPSSPILLSISLEAFVWSFAIWISYAVERSSGEAHAGTRDGIGRYYTRRFEPPAVPGEALLWFSIEGSGFVVVHDPSGRRFSVMPVAEALAGSGAGRYVPR